MRRKLEQLFKLINCTKKEYYSILGVSQSSYSRICNPKDHQGFWNRKGNAKAEFIKLVDKLLKKHGGKR